MNDNDSLPNQTSGKLLNWVFGLAIALVACAIGWVGWICIDSLQKHTGKLENYHSTAENTKIDSHRYDIVKNEVDSQIFSDKLTSSQEIQGALVKQEGSELLFSSGQALTDKKQYPQAVANFSQVLALIPVEAKKKTTWFAYGGLTEKNTFTMWALRQRAQCYIEMGSYGPAIADLTEAIKRRPDSVTCLQYRAKAYYKIGKTALGDADLRSARANRLKYPGEQQLP